MTLRAFCPFLALFLLSTGLCAQDILPFGKFELLNTAGFVEQGGVRTPLKRDSETGSALLSPSGSEDIMLEINGTEIILYKLPNGLATLTWDASNSSLLHGIDIEAMRDGKPAEDIPAWGANVAWPGIGNVQIVILPLSENANTGFLVSKPGSKTVVRQMEFRKVFGPKGRPGTFPGARSHLPPMN
ncbi:MAG: hypothetical protein ABJL55_11690 [Roseibium sp.]